MNIAFYAPMKSPHHPRPSGDRRIARLLIKALQAMGHSVEVMSELRAWEGQGISQAQLKIEQQGKTIAEDLIRDINSRPEAQQPDVWFTYHLYHKAPDWIGPRIASECHIPYVVAEASYADKQLHGPWSVGLKQVLTCLQQASAIICLNPRDVVALEKLPACANKIHSLQPFLDISGINLAERAAIREQLAKQYNLSPDLPWIISVAMMRDDAKLLSYQALAESLRNIKVPYQLLLVGDGKARHKVEDLFSGSLTQHTRYAGELDQQATMQALLASDLFVWPAVNEAIGMAILEAQACGLPVVVGESGAISEFVLNGVNGYLSLPDDTQAMAAAIELLLTDANLRKQFGLKAINNIEQQPSLRAAAISLEQVLNGLHNS